MQLIKHGKKPPKVEEPWVGRQWICTHCGAIVLLESSDKWNGDIHSMDNPHPVSTYQPRGLFQKEGVQAKCPTENSWQWFEAVT